MFTTLYQDPLIKRRIFFSGRCYQDVFGRQLVKADGASLYLDHAVLGLDRADQLNLRTGQYPELGHAGTEFAVTAYLAHLKSFAAIRL